MTENIRVGDLVLFKPKNIFSKLLCKINKTKYTHAAMIYSVDDEILIFDTDYYFTKICNLSIYEKENYDIYILNRHISDNERRAMKKWMEQNLDVPYGFANMLSSMTRFILNINFVLHSKDKYISSETVDIMYKKVLDIDLVPEYDFGEITPDDLIESKNFIQVKGV